MTEDELVGWHYQLDGHEFEQASLIVQLVKNLPAGGRTGFDPWVGKILWRRAWPPTPVFLAWRIRWTEGPGGLQSMQLQRLGHD